MSGEANPVHEFSKLFQAWMESVQQLWQQSDPSTQQQFGGADFTFNFAPDNEEPEEDKYRTYRSWETALSNYTAFLKLMTAPENQEAIAKGTSNFFEALVETTGESLENFTEFQAQLVKSMAKVGEHTKAYNYDDLDHESFESFRELYRTELQKYFNMPKIGLPREFHERLSKLVDTSNIYYSHLMELVYLFSLPFEKTNRAMQRKFKEMLEKGEIPEDYKQAYGDWIKTLEGHYMELLKSPEYTHVLNDFIGSLAAYKHVKNDVMEVFIKDMQIPTNKEMDAVYRDLYQMKRKVRDLSRQVEALQHELKRK